jgi:hypothetical protein
MQSGEIAGPREIRSVDPIHQWFNPWRTPKRLRYPVVEAS